MAGVEFNRPIPIAQKIKGKIEDVLSDAFGEVWEKRDMDGSVIEVHNWTGPTHQYLPVALHEHRRDRLVRRETRSADDIPVELILELQKRLK